MVLTNNLTVHFNHEKIADHFIICEVNREKTFQSGKDKHQFKYDPRLFDVPLSFFHVKSIVYLYGGTFFVLFDQPKKAKNNKRHFRQAIENLDPHAMITFLETAADIKKFLCKPEGKRVLTQLFLNALDTRSKINDDCQNIGGHLYYKRIKSKYKNQLSFIEARIINGDVTGELLLTLPVVTFTKLNDWLLKDNPHAIFYIIDENGNFKRHLGNVKTLSDTRLIPNIYIQKANSSHKNTLTLLSIKDTSKFNSSKLGIASHMIRDINTSFGDYLSVSLTPKDFKKSQSFEQENRFMINDSTISDVFNRDGLHIIDLVCDNASNAFLHGQFSNTANANLLDMLKTLKIRPENITIVRQNKNKGLDESLLLSKEHFNICLIENDQDDINHHHYQNVPVQHIGIYHTDETAKMNNPKKELLSVNRKGEPTIFKKVLYELLIKKDIISKQLLNMNWSAFAKGKTWTFILPTLKNNGSKKNKIAQFDQMCLHPDGRFDFDHFEEIDFPDENDIKQKVIDFYDTLTRQDAYRRSRIEMIFFTDSSNMQAVIHTESFPLPDIHHLSEDFKNPYFPKRMWQLLNAFKDSLDNQEDQKAIIATIDHLKKEKANLSTKTTYSVIRKHLSKKLLNTLEDYLMQNGIMLKPGSKGKCFEDRYHFEDMVSCHYNRPDIKTFYYYIGLTKREDLNLSFAKSDLIRKVVAQKQVDPDTYLALLKTNLVRAHKFSVLPFPAKYIREARDMAVGHVLD